MHHKLEENRFENDKINSEYVSQNSTQFEVLKRRGVSLLEGVPYLQKIWYVFISIDRSNW